MCMNVVVFLTLKKKYVRFNITSFCSLFLSLSYFWFFLFWTFFMVILDTLHCCKIRRNPHSLSLTHFKFRLLRSVWILFLFIPLPNSEQTAAKQMKKKVRSSDFNWQFHSNAQKWKHFVVCLFSDICLKNEKYLVCTYCLK